MKKAFVFMLTIALLLSLSIPAMATEVTVADASDLRSIAYMNLDTADEQTRTNILAARNEIMFSTSWVADDVNGWVLDENGVVIETLPHFSEVFPSDWDSAVPCDLNITQKYVDLTRTSSTFYTVNTVRNVGSAEWHVETISTQAMYESGAKCNLGYKDNTTGVTLGYKSDLEDGKSLKVEVPDEDTTVSIYASTTSHVGTWTMVIAIDQYDAYA